jgi:hypothetical protein
VESILCQDRVLHSARKKRKKRKENNSSRRQRQSLSFRRSYIFPRPRFSDSNRTYHSPSRVNTRRLRLHSCRQLSSIVISSLHNESNEGHGYECTVPDDIARHESSPEHLSQPPVFMYHCATDKVIEQTEKTSYETKTSGKCTYTCLWFQALTYITRFCLDHLAISFYSVFPVPRTATVT